jgi:hypothetical protein
VLHELASTLTVQPVPAAPNGTSSIASTLSIIPPNPPNGAVWAAAEVIIPTPNTAFPTPYIYTSNRNTGTQDARGDAITIAQYSGGALSAVAYVYTGIDQIRGMGIGGANNEFVIVGGYAGSGGVAVFRRTNGGANLTFVARDTTLPTRTSFVWL